MPGLSCLQCPPVIRHRDKRLTQTQICSSGKGCLGQRVIRRRGKSVVEVSLDLGGKIPTLVFVPLHIDSEPGSEGGELEIRVGIDIDVFVVETYVLRNIVEQVFRTCKAFTAVECIVIPYETVNFKLRC